MTLDTSISEEINMLKRFKRYAEENMADFDSSGEEVDARTWQDEFDYFLNHVSET